MYDSAIANFEAAKALEEEAAAADVRRHTDAIDALTKNIEQLLVYDILSLLVVRWDATEGTIQAKNRDETHRVLLGLTPDEDVPLELVRRFMAPIESLMREKFVYDGASGLQQTISYYDLRLNGGPAGLTDAIAPAPAEAGRLQQRYGDFTRELEREIVPHLPAVAKVRTTRENLMAYIANEGARRKERIDASYASLLDITRAARSYSGPLTDNVQFIQLANKLLGTANGLLGDAKGSQ